MEFSNHSSSLMFPSSQQTRKGMKTSGGNEAHIRKDANERMSTRKVDTSIFAAYIKYEN